MIEGDLPSPIKPPSGCVFLTRSQASAQCGEEKPELLGDERHRIACIFAHAQ